MKGVLAAMLMVPVFLACHPMVIARTLYQTHTNVNTARVLPALPPAQQSAHRATFVPQTLSARSHPPLNNSDSFQTSSITLGTHSLSFSKKTTDSSHFFPETNGFTGISSHRKIKAGDLSTVKSRSPPHRNDHYPFRSDTLAVDIRSPRKILRNSRITTDKHSVIDDIQGGNHDNSDSIENQLLLSLIREISDQPKSERPSKTDSVEEHGTLEHTANETSEFMTQNGNNLPHQSISTMSDFPKDSHLSDQVFNETSIHAAADTTGKHSSSNDMSDWSHVNLFGNNQNHESILENKINKKPSRESDHSGKLQRNDHEDGVVISGKHPRLTPGPITGHLQAQFRSKSMLDMAVANLQEPTFSLSPPGFGLFQGASDGGRRSSDDWWSQDVWSGSSSGTSGGDDLSIWFPKTGQQDNDLVADSGSANTNTADTDNAASGSAGTSWWQGDSDSGDNHQPASSAFASSSSSSSSLSSSLSSSTSSNSWGSKNDAPSSSGDSSLGSFSYSLWQSVAANQKSPSNSASTAMIGSGSNSNWNMGSSSGGGFTSTDAVPLSQQGGMASSGVQPQGGGSTGFAQGMSSGLTGLFSFGLPGSSSGDGTASPNAQPASDTGGGGVSGSAGGFDFGSGLQGFGSGSSSSGSSVGGMFSSNNNNNINNAMNTNNNDMDMNSNVMSLFSFGGDSSMNGFSMGGGTSGNGMGGSTMTSGMSPGFGGSQGNTGDNTAGMFYTFAQAQSAPGAKTGAGFGASQGIASKDEAGQGSGGSTFPLQGTGSSGKGTSGYWGSQSNSGGGGSSQSINGQGGAMMAGGGAFQFSGGLSENNNAWQFSGMTNPGFSNPGFGGSQASGAGLDGGGSGAGFGSSQGGMFSFSGSPGFGMTQGGGSDSAGYGSSQGGGGVNLNSFTMANNAGSMGVPSNMMSANGASMGGATSNQGGSLAEILVKFTKESGANEVKEDVSLNAQQPLDTSDTGSPLSIPQFLDGSVSSKPFNNGMPNTNTGPSTNSGNLFTGGGAPISGFAIGGGGQISSPSSAAKFTFWAGDSQTGGDANLPQPGAGGGAPAFSGPASPFSGAVSGGGGAGSAEGENGAGSSMGSPFSSALTGDSPFGSTGNSPFGLNSGSGSFLEATGSNPFNWNTKPQDDSNTVVSYNPFGSGSSDSLLSSPFNSNQFNQFMPQFSSHGSQANSNSQMGNNMFAIFQFPNGGDSDNSNLGNQFFGNSDFQSFGDSFSNMFPSFLSQAGTREVFRPNTLALSRLVHNLAQTSNENQSDVDVVDLKDTKQRGEKTKKEPLLPSNKSEMLSEAIDDKFILRVVRHYCAQFLARRPERRHTNMPDSQEKLENKNIYGKVKPNSNGSDVVSTIQSYLEPNPFRERGESLRELCDSLQTGT